MPGKDGMEKMAALLKEVRENPPKSVDAKSVTEIWDYKTQVITNNSGTCGTIEGLPKSDVMKFYLSDGKTYFIIRPSGTEPKLKIYYLSEGKTYDEAKVKAQKAKAEVSEIIKSVII